MICASPIQCVTHVEWAALGARKAYRNSYDKCPWALSYSLCGRAVGFADVIRDVWFFASRHGRYILFSTSWYTCMLKPCTVGRFWQSVAAVSYAQRAESVAEYLHPCQDHMHVFGLWLWRGRRPPPDALVRRFLCQRRSLVWVQIRVPEARNKVPARRAPGWWKQVLTVHVSRTSALVAGSYSLRSIDAIHQPALSSVNIWCNKTTKGTWSAHCAMGRGQVRSL